jgi:excisionase family DNA binding protein
MLKALRTNYCTTREAAEVLGVSLRSVQLWSENGLLEVWKTKGGHRRISRTSVERLATGNSTSPHFALSAKFVQPASPMERIKVLVVEDDSILVKLYRAAVASWDLPVETITATNSTEGLILIGRDAPDLLIVDLAIPGMNGIQLINNLTASSFAAGMEIVVVTGMDSDQIASHGGLPENIRVLSKPVPFATLHAICTDLLVRRSAYLQPSA